MALLLMGSMRNAQMSSCSFNAQWMRSLLTDDCAIR